jgi:hypothetical protein
VQIAELRAEVHDGPDPLLRDGAQVVVRHGGMPHGQAAGDPGQFISCHTLTPATSTIHASKGHEQIAPTFLRGLSVEKILGTFLEKRLDALQMKHCSSPEIHPLLMRPQTST